MITLTRITDSNSPAYRFTEELLTATFPRDEYRDLCEQRKNADTNRCFHLMLASEGNENIGFISYWDLVDFCYIEHFATLPAMRGKGYGKAILEQLKQEHNNIVLEVECPTDSITHRRINFYNRTGFALCKIPYTQPSYRKDGNTVPMHLMFSGCEGEMSDYKKAKRAIYETVYNIKE